jgi:uncharacterized protein (TIGR00369 family)
MQNSVEITLEKWRKDEAEVRSNKHTLGYISTDELKLLSGLEFIQGMMQGKYPLPNIAHMLNFVLVEAISGQAVFQGTPTQDHYNSLGGVHGGYFCTLLDSAAACAVQTMLPKGSGYTSLELKTNFIRALTDKTGPIRAEGKVIQVGRQIGIAEARIVDAAGKIYAHATTTCLIFPLN